MNLKPKDVSTIVILNKNQSGNKTLQVSTKHISRFKYYIMSVVAIIVFLVGFIFLQHYQNKQQELEKQQLLSQIVKLKGDVPVNIAKMNDNGAAQNYIQKIEGKLKNINDYLKKRGLKGFSTKDVGGDNNAEGKKLSPKETYQAYDDYLGKLLNAVAYTPMGYPRVSAMTSVFGYRSDPFNRENAEYHPGIDFEGHKGDDVKSTANGRVVFAGWSNGYGNCVRIAHANNFETLYGHMSKIIVKEGQQITTGQKVGEVGSTGHSTGTHLHYEVRQNGKPINPVKFLTLNN